MNSVRLQTLEGVFGTLPKHTSSSCYITSRRVHTNTPHRRNIHSSPHNDNSAAYPNFDSPAANAVSATKPTKAEASTLAFLPLTQVLRSYLITAVSSSPRMLDASSAVLRRMLESKNFLFSLEKNPLARALLYNTFYKQFCAGSTPEQVSATSKQLREQGYGGVILEYAREVLKDAESHEIEDVATWQKGMLASVSIAQEGDFIGLKWSGMGPAALRLCAAQKEPSEAMDKAMKLVSKAAAEKGEERRAAVPPLGHVRHAATVLLRRRKRRSAIAAPPATAGTSRYQNENTVTVTVRTSVRTASARPLPARMRTAEASTST